MPRLRGRHRISRTDPSRSGRDTKSAFSKPEPSRSRRIWSYMAFCRVRETDRALLIPAGNKSPGMRNRTVSVSCLDMFVLYAEIISRARPFLNEPAIKYFAPAGEASSGEKRKAFPPAMLSMIESSHAWLVKRRITFWSRPRNRSSTGQCQSRLMPASRRRHIIWDVSAAPSAPGFAAGELALCQFAEGGDAELVDLARDAL